MGASSPLVGQDAPRRLEAVELGHADVHQDDVGPQRAHLVDRLAAVRGLADDLDVGLGVEDHAEAGAHERLVVDEQDADHVRDLQRQHGAQDEPAAFARARVERAAVDGDPLAHADEPVPAPACRSGCRRRRR